MTVSVSVPLAGVPPVGVGIYDPSGRRAGEPWAYRAVNPSRASGADFLFLGPSHTTPGLHEQAMARLAAGVGPLTGGAFVDPENGWPQLRAEERREHFATLAAGLLALARRTRVILTSHGGFPWDALASALGPVGRRSIVVSPQLYYEPATNARVYQRVKALFGTRVLPSIAGPRGIATPPAEWSTAAGYARYLDGVPRDVPGVIVWDLTTMRPDAIEAINERWGVARGLPFLAAAAADTWVGAAVAVLLLALAALVLFRG